MYQAEKLQRKTETEVRHQKDRATISKAANYKDMYDESQRKIKLLRSKYKQLSKASGLPTKMERMRVDGSKNSKIKSVDNSVNSGIIKENEHRVSELGKFKAKINTDKNITKDYHSVIKTKFSHGSDTAKKVFNKYIPENSIEKSNYRGVPHYNVKTKKIYMSYISDMNNPRGNGITWFHEHGHMVDDLADNVSKDKLFKKILDDDVMAYRRKYGKEHGLKTFDKVDAGISKELSSMRKHSGVSDMFEGLTKGNISGIAGHGTDYWHNNDNITSEAFAHMFASEFDNVRYKEMQKYFPQSLEYFENKMKELIR